MQTRSIAVIMLIVVAALLPGGNPRANVESVVAPDREVVNPEDALAIVLNMPIVRWLATDADECDRIGPEMQLLHELLDLGNCDASGDYRNLHGIALAAIQGLYAQLQTRDKFLVELNEQNRTLQRELAALEAARREDRALLIRLETQITTIQTTLERQVGSTPLTSPEMQNHQLSQRLSTVETDRRGNDSRLNRIESRLDTSLSNLESRTRDLQSRMSRLESRMMTLPRN